MSVLTLRVPVFFPASCVHLDLIFISLFLSYQFLRSGTKKNSPAAQYKQNMEKPFLSPNTTTPSADVVAFVHKMKQYHNHCEVEAAAVRGMILQCRVLEALVDEEIAVLSTEESLHGFIPTDSSTLVKMTRSAWRAELLMKLKNTLLKIASLSVTSQRHQHVHA